ncbi:hypothetical protein V5E97_34840 [Singulisphaera sp. Ch08]|uniref:Uncharacterized protein n=1 Tax=Singulisphaera sp. Ch08 TaxID=3120278 RepID=A0AAU7CEM2_9BACT
MDPGSFAVKGRAIVVPLRPPGTPPLIKANVDSWTCHLKQMAEIKHGLLTHPKQPFLGTVEVDD